MSGICLIAGRSNRSLALKISELLEIQLDNTEISNFSDGEISVKIGASVRGKECFVVQSGSTNEYILELLIMLDALKRSSAEKINVVLPYYPYARQDRKVESRVPITAKLMADLLITAGANNIIAVDLHVGQIQGFFNRTCDNVYALPTIAGHVLQGRESIRNVTVVSPDVGGVARARTFAEHIKAPLAIIDKRRPKANQSKVMHVIGEVKDQQCILIDDIVDTAGTLCQAADALLKEGATNVNAICTHGVLSGDAVKKLENGKLGKLIITDSIEPNEDILKCEKIEIITISQLLAEVIRRIKNGESLNNVFH